MGHQSVRATFETLEGSGVMNIWVEPLEWDEEQKGGRPIKQLEVRTWNYLDSQRARDWEAFRELEHGCKLTTGDKNTGTEND